MHNVKTLLREDYKNKEGESAVTLQVYIKGKRVVLTTGILVTQENWDPLKGMIKSKHQKAKDFNLIIEQSRALVNEIMVKYRLEGRQLTPDLLRSEYKNPSKYIDFIEWMRQEISERKGVLSPSTIVMHLSILGCLEKFSQKIHFSELDHIFLERFEKHLKVKVKNRVDTISKKMRVLRMYLNRAKRNNIIKQNPFDQFKIKKGKGRIVFLEEHEIIQMNTLYHRELAPKNMKKVLRYFLFSCVTGLRLADVKSLRYDDIVNDTIMIIPKKKMNTDHETVTIPLSVSAKKILLEGGPMRFSGRIFETYTDQVTNRYLKDIAKLLKIRKHITFNTARHTFATYFYDRTNDLATLQKLMGHGSIMQTMVYAHVSDKKKREQIKVFDQVL